ALQQDPPLDEGPARQRLARNAGRKPEIIFDAHARCGLPVSGAKSRQVHTTRRFFSLPPCGGGSGWGVGRLRHNGGPFADPRPPSPQGGGEKERRAATTFAPLTDCPP